MTPNNKLREAINDTISFYPIPLGDGVSICLGKIYHKKQIEKLADAIIERLSLTEEKLKEVIDLIAIKHKFMHDNKARVVDFMAFRDHLSLPIARHLLSTMTEEPK
jgi:hypothetical protein